MNTVNQLFDLSGQVALVTGAGSGLGVIFSEALAEAGADIVCADINVSGAEQTAAQVRQLGRDAIAVSVDVAHQLSVEQMIQTTMDRFGRLDVVVNNAGIAAGGPPETLSLADWQRVVDVNLTGVFLTAQAAALVMIPAGGGRIINIASILGAAASEPIPAAPYAATKGAVVNLTRDLAVHWASHNIRVNAIGPSYFSSAMTKDLLANPELEQEIERRTPMGRTGRPEELKGPIIFLASQASSYVTGHTLYVDGGWLAW